MDSVLLGAGIVSLAALIGLPAGALTATAMRRRRRWTDRDDRAVQLESRRWHE